MWFADQTQYEKNIHPAARNIKWYNAILFCKDESGNLHTRSSKHRCKTVADVFVYAHKWNQRARREFQRPYRNTARSTGKFKWTWRSIWNWLISERLPINRKSLITAKDHLLFDVSDWEGEINFTTMKNFPISGVIIKAGQGFAAALNFSKYWLNAKIAGLLRGSYWFYDSRVAPKTQAALWWSLLKNDPPELKCWVDYEENYGGPYKGLTNLKIFMEEFLRLSGMPVSNVGIYTGYYYWIDQAPIANMSWFAQFWLWEAWYISDPKYVLIPPPWTQDKVLLWQFGTPLWGKQAGTQSAEIDAEWFVQPANQFNTIFNVNLSTSDMIRTERFGCKVYIDTVKPSPTQKISVVNSYDLPSNLAKKYGAQRAWNGDDWNRTTLKPLNNNEPSLMIFPDGSLKIGNKSTTSGYTYSTSGLRYLVQNGLNVIPPNGTELKYTERHARSITCLTASGSLLHITIDGDFPDKGALLWESAEIAREFGAVTAFDQGGGGDSVDVMDGVVVNVPDDDINGVHYERKVPQTILVRNTTMPITNYESFALTANTRLRPGHDTNNAYDSLWPVGTKFQGDELFIAPMALGTYQYVGDKWLKVTRINDIVLPTFKWVAIIDKGLVITDFHDYTTPPVVDSFTVDFTARDVKVSGDVYEAKGVVLKKVA